MIKEKFKEGDWVKVEGACDTSKKVDGKIMQVTTISEYDRDLAIRVDGSICVTHGNWIKPSKEEIAFIKLLE